MPCGKKRKRHKMATHKRKSGSERCGIRRSSARGARPRAHGREAGRVQEEDAMPAIILRTATPNRRRCPCGSGGIRCISKWIVLY